MTCTEVGNNFSYISCLGIVVLVSVKYCTLTVGNSVKFTKLILIGFCAVCIEVCTNCSLNQFVSFREDLNANTAFQLQIPFQPYDLSLILRILYGSKNVLVIVISKVPSHQ